MKLVRIGMFCFALLGVFSLQGWSQSSPAEAFKNMTIHTADGNTIKSGTIVWRNGIITSVGKDIPIPFDAYVRDGGDSLHVYPGFIDGLAYWGSPKVKDEVKTPNEPGNPSYNRAGIQPQRNPTNQLKWDHKALDKAPEYGFTTAALALKGQMLPGKVDLFFINGSKTENHELQNSIGLLAQFKEAQGAAYPSTTMALMNKYRQLFNDAKALKEQQQYFASTSTNYPAPEKNRVLEALYPVMDRSQPFYFVVDSKENIERMFWLQDELGVDVILVSGKEAYRKADEIKQRGIPVLASIDLPEEPEWRAKDEDEKPKDKEKEVTEEMQNFRERQLQAYKADIQNISKLIDAGVTVGFASNGLKFSDFQKHLKTLREKGEISDEQILRMLSQSTADILGYGQKMGDIKKGRIASFTVFSKPFMDEKAKAIYSVTDGELTEFEPESSND